MVTAEAVVIRAPRSLRLTIPVVAALTVAGLVTLPSPGAKVGALLVAAWWFRTSTCWVRADRELLHVRNTLGTRAIPWADVDGWVVRPGHVDVVVAGRPVTIDALSRTGLGRGAQARGEAAVRALTRPRRQAAASGAPGPPPAPS